MRIKNISLIVIATIISTASSFGIERKKKKKKEKKKKKKKSNKGTKTTSTTISNVNASSKH